MQFRVKNSLEQSQLHPKQGCHVTIMTQSLCPQFAAPVANAYFPFCCYNLLYNSPYNPWGEEVAVTRAYTKLFMQLAPGMTNESLGPLLSLLNQVDSLNSVLPTLVPHITLPTQDIMQLDTDKIVKVITAYCLVVERESFYTKDSSVRETITQELDDIAHILLEKKIYKINVNFRFLKLLKTLEEELNYSFLSKTHIAQFKKQVATLESLFAQHKKNFTTINGAVTQQNDPGVLFRVLRTYIMLSEGLNPQHKTESITNIIALRQFIQRTKLTYENAWLELEKAKGGDTAYALVLIDLLLAYKSLGVDVQKLEEIRDESISAEYGTYASWIDERSRVFQEATEGKFPPHHRTLAFPQIFANYHNLEIPSEYYFFPPGEGSIIIPAQGLFMMTLKEQDSSFPDLFLQLMKKFQYVSSLPVDETQKRPVESFFPQYYRKIFLLTEIMGKSAFKWMSDQLAQTVLPLERLLTNLPDNLPHEAIDLLKAYFEKNTSLIMSHNLKSWQNILIGIGAQCEIAKHLNQKVDISLIRSSLAEEPKNASSKINYELMRILLNSMEVSAEIIDRIDIQAALEKITPYQFPLLVREYLSMKSSGNPFALILNGLMTRFLTQQDVDEYLHATDSQIGQHNKKIQEKLRAAGIDPSTALHYDKKVEFSIGAEQATQQQKQASSEAALITYLDQLRQKISDKFQPSDGRTKSQFNKIQEAFAEIKDWKNAIKKHWGHIVTIKKNCKTLLDNSDIKQQETLREFRECAQHVVDTYDDIEKLKKPLLSDAPAASTASAAAAAAAAAEAVEAAGASDNSGFFNFSISS